MYIYICIYRYILVDMYIYIYIYISVCVRVCVSIILHPTIVITVDSCWFSSTSMITRRCPGRLSTALLHHGRVRPPRGRRKVWHIKLIALVKGEIYGFHGENHGKHHGTTMVSSRGSLRICMCVFAISDCRWSWSKIRYHARHAEVRPKWRLG